MASAILIQSESNLASSMDLVPVNDTSAENRDETPEKCRHFSIRGYVSEVRKKDPKLCYPFTRKDSIDPLCIELPPMVVPKFRWWQCVSCVPEASTSCGVENIESQKPDGVVETSLPLVGESSKVFVPRGRNADTSTSIDSNENRNFLNNVFADPKGKGKAYVEDKPAAHSARENGFVKESIQGYLQQTGGKSEDSPAVDNEVGALGVRCNGNGNIEAVQNECREDGTKAGRSQENRLADLANNVVGVEVNDGPGIDRKTRVVNLPDLNECSGEALYDENNGALITISNNDVLSEDDDDYLGAERRKFPKTRLLSELLRVPETQNLGKGRKKNPSSSNCVDEKVKRKKVGYEEEGLKSMEIRIADSGNSEYDSECSTESDDYSTEIISKALVKRQCKSKMPLLETRLSKKSKLDHGSTATSISRQKIISRSENMVRKTDRLIDRSSVMTKKRGTQTGKETMCSIPRVPKDFIMTQRVEKSPAHNIPNVDENDLQVPTSFIIKRNCQAQAQARVLDDGLCLPSSQLVEEKHSENRVNVEETNVAFTGDFIDRNGETTNLKKKSGTPEAEESGPLPQEQDTPLQVSNQVRNGKEQMSEVRRRKHDIDINSIPTDDKVPDDIPMDIVELMAKNQYERHFGDLKEKQDNPAPPGNSGKYTQDDRVNTSYGEYWKKFGQSHFLSMRNPTTPDPRKGIVNGNMVRFSDYNRNSSSVPSCHPRENPISARFISPIQTQEHNFPRGLDLNNWNRNFSMETTQRYSSNYFQPLESYTFPRPSTPEPSSVWPPVTANRVPLGIANSPMVAHPHKNKFGHHHTSSSILNFNVPGSVSIGKQQNLNFSNRYNVGAHLETSAGSVDGYTNDAISAMHLLSSMMQNAAKIQDAAVLSLAPPQQGVPATSSRHLIIDNIQKTAHHPCYPTPIPIGRSFTSTFQTDGGNIRKNNNSTGTGFLGPIPLTLRGQRNIENSHFSLQGPQTRHVKGSSLDKGKNPFVIAHPSQPYPTPLQTSSFLVWGGVRRDDRTISPTPETMICKLNQNPSEFNDLKKMSRYMIGPEDLKPRGKPRVKSSRFREDSKRQDVKLNKHNLPGKEREKQRKP
ncbi:unnamed protein product [Amaranthus hypochondriacus]